MNNDLEELKKQLEFAISYSEESEKARRYYNAVIGLEQGINHTYNFLKHLRATFDEHDEMYDLLSEAMSLLKFRGDRDE